MKLICIGDSLTFGYGINKSSCFVSLLKVNTFFNVINKGINGDTSTGILCRFSRDVVDNTPSMCTILCGTNDILSNRSPDSVFDNIKTMINDCIINNIIPIILSPPKILTDLATIHWSPTLNYSLINSNISDLNDMLHSFCIASNISYISLFDSIPNEKQYYTDGLHLSVEGNYLLYSNIKKAMLF